MSKTYQASGRVVITGLGAVTPVGNSVDEFWSRLIAGESGIGEITLLDTDAYPTKIAGEVKDFNAEDWLDRKEARKVDRFIAFACAASDMALADANFPMDDEDLKENVGF
ncbi:MAG: beta-ketoacyl synthase N-terminal-like domain-containing protein [Fimbriimonadaceae bacterium]